MFSNDPIFQKAFQETAARYQRLHDLQTRLAALEAVYYGPRFRGREDSYERYQLNRTINRIGAELNKPPIPWYFPIPAFDQRYRNIRDVVENAATTSSESAQQRPWDYRDDVYDAYRG